VLRCDWSTCGHVTAVPASIERDTDPLEYRAMEDDTVMLRCRASGVPAPTVRWTRRPANHRPTLGRAPAPPAVNQTDLGADPRYRLLRSGWLAIALVRYHTDSRLSRLIFIFVNTTYNIDP